MMPSILSRAFAGRSRELSWAAPWVCLGLVALALFRPEPVIPLPSISGRVITDMHGTEVTVPLNPRAVFYGQSAWYLEASHSPESLADAGTPGDRISFAKGFMGLVYPSVVANLSVWHPQDGTFENFLANDRGYTYFVWDPTELRRWGLNSVAWDGEKLNTEVFPGWNGMQMTGRNQSAIGLTKVTNASLGHDQQGNWLIAIFADGYRSLLDDLKPAALKNHPTFLDLGSVRDEWDRLIVLDQDPIDDWREGITDASIGLVNDGRQQDPERILAMNPDIIVTWEPVDVFKHDPRWTGLKAVRDNKIYNGPLGDFTGHGGNLAGLTSDALWARWTAEIAHPDLMPCGLRNRLRTYVLKLYGYRLSEAQIDDLLNVDANRNSANYARFLTNGAGGQANEQCGP